MPALPALPDAEFAEHIAGRLATLPGVRAVALGGSRATGTQRPDSDWDFAVYYRGGAFSPADLRGLGWPGEVSELGAWGGGVFNGGAWLSVDERRVDVHYRDLEDVEYRLSEAEAGRFEIERLLFHLAGIPTYLVVAELALNRVLHGVLPCPAYPEALRRTAPARWSADARATLAYARSAHASHGHLTDTAGALATAACQTAHAVLAGRAQWTTNEKHLLDHADLRAPVDELLSGLTPDPAALTSAMDSATALLESALAGGERG